MKKRILSIVLMIAMVLTFMPTATFAAGEDEFHYVSLGDSKTTGFGLEDYNKDGVELNGFNQIVSEAYPALIKAMLEKAGKKVVLHQFAGSAMRPDDLDAILNPEHVDDDYTSRVFSGHDRGKDTNGDEWFKTWGQLLDKSVTDCTTGEVVLRNEFNSAIEEADLITYYLGTNNLGSFITAALTDDRYGDTDTLQDLLDTIGISEETLNVEELRESVLESLGGEEGDDSSIATLVSEYGDIADLIVQGFVGFIVYFTKNIEAIRELNPDCDLVVAGLHNYAGSIKVEMNGEETDLGELYGKLYKVANIYIGYLCKNSDNYYYADLEKEKIPTFYDDLLAGKISTSMQKELDGMVGGIAKDTVAGLDSFTDEEVGSMLRRWYKSGFNDSDYPILAKIAEERGLVDEDSAATLDKYGITLEDALKLSELYYNESDEFVPAFDKALENAANDNALIKVFKALLKSNGNYITFQKCKDYISLAASLGLDLSVLGEVGEKLNGIKQYGRAQEILLSCISDEAINFDEIASLIDSGIDMGAVGGELLSVVSGEKAEVSAGTKGLINIYFKLIFPDGKGIGVHPNEKGHKAIANVIYNAYKNKTIAKEYKEADTYAFIEELITKIADPESTRVESFGTFRFKDFDPKSYVSLGDSTVFGFGLDDFAIDSEIFETTYGYDACSKYAYPVLLKNQLGIEDENFKQLAMGSIRVEDVLYILDNDDTGDEFYRDVVLPHLDKNAGGLEKAHNDYINSIKNSDLISICIGGNNFGTFLDQQLKRYEEESPLIELDWSKYPESELADNKDMIDQIFAKLEESNPDTDYTLMRNLAENLAYEYMSVTEGIKQIYDKIHSLNPNAKIIIMGLFNPARDVYYQTGDGPKVSIGKAVNLALKGINKAFRSYAEEHSDYCCFINVEDTPLFVDYDGVDLNLEGEEYIAYLRQDHGIANHPNIAGHQFMFQQIVRTLGCADNEHVWDAGEIIKKATETATGTKAYRCTVCGLTKTETIAKLKHTHKYKVTKATLTKNGKVSGTCTECGKKVKDNKTVYAVDTVKLSYTSTTYNGKAKAPSVTVKDTKGNKLTKDKDYTVTYASGRKNVGSYKVTVKGKGNYSFTKTLTFKIKAAGIDTAKLSYTSTTYNGKAKKPAVKVVDKNGNTLVSGTDYTATYASGRKKVGSYKVTVKGKGNYSFTKELTFKIKAAGIDTAKLSTTSYTYNGKAKKPTVTVVDKNGNTLKKDTDYTVKYADGRKNVGSYKVTVKGKGNYSFTKTLTFKINPPKATLSSASKKSATSITVKWKKVSNVTGYQIKYVDSEGTSKTVKVKGASTVSKAITELTEGETYAVSIRTYKTVSGTTYYSGYSTAKSVELPAPIVTDPYELLED